MKNKAIEITALILGLLTTVAGVLTLPQVAMLPQDWQPYVALSLALVVVGKNGAYVILDFCDDGQLNKSYKLPPGMHVLLLCGLLLITLPSCGLNRSQWLEIGKGVLLREAPIVYGQVKQAREVTSAKQSIDVQP